MKEAYIDRKFSEGSMAIIDQANGIIEDYQAQGFTLTLRQLYYQFVARGILPNKQAEYDKLGSIINYARLAGLVDWEAIEDRTRNLEARAAWSSPADIIKACAAQFHVDFWKGQKARPEVWIEKEALVGVVEPICEELDIAYFACRGYSSQSEQWRAGKRFCQRWDDSRQSTVILHLGDHDPSGIDMTRDNRTRLELFTSQFGDIVEVQRLALNMDQVDQYNPPPNPAKMTDSRAEGYVAQYGDSSWELDALDPPVIAALIREAVDPLIDNRLWDERKELEKRGRERLSLISEDLKKE